MSDSEEQESLAAEYEKLSTFDVKRKSKQYIPIDFEALLGFADKLPKQIREGTEGDFLTKLLLLYQEWFKNSVDMKSCKFDQKVARLETLGRANYYRSQIDQFRFPNRNPVSSNEVEDYINNYDENRPEHPTQEDEDFIVDPNEQWRASLFFNENEEIDWEPRNPQPAERPIVSKPAAPPAPTRQTPAAKPVQPTPPAPKPVKPTLPNRNVSTQQPSSRTFSYPKVHKPAPVNAATQKPTPTPVPAVAPQKSQDSQQFFDEFDDDFMSDALSFAEQAESQTRD